jgi:hypothetical protein
MSVDKAAVATAGAAIHREGAAPETRRGAPEARWSADEGGAGAEDLFVLARRAAAARRAALGDRASFVRSRQLLSTGAWRGPRDATESWVEQADLPALGGWSAARAAGVDLLVGGGAPEIYQAALADGARLLWRLPFRSGEEPAVRLARLEALRRLVTEGLAVWGVMPIPDSGEPEGLDTLRLVAGCRLTLPGVPHVVADVAALGPRLAQMCLGFGADELRAPIVAERALRLGDNARNPALTRKEAAILIRGAGLTPCERLADHVLEEVR